MIRNPLLRQSAEVTVLADYQAISPSPPSSEHTESYLPATLMHQRRDGDPDLLPRAWDANLGDWLIHIISG